MEVIIGVMGCAFVTLAVLRPDLLPLSMAAVLLYVPYYVAFLLFCGAVLPGFFEIWNGPDLWGWRLFGLPVDEAAFVLAFAACYPLIIGVALAARLSPQATPQHR